MGLIHVFLMEDGSQLHEWDVPLGEYPPHGEDIHVISLTTGGEYTSYLVHRVVPAEGQDLWDNQATDLLVDRREHLKELAARWVAEQEEYARPGGIRDQLLARAASGVREKSLPN